jgi:hypothetical protein
MLVRGKYIILTIALIAIGAAGFAWCYNVQQSRRSVEFWGRATAELLRDASEADLLRLAHGAGVSTDDKATLKFGDKVYHVVERKTVHGARGEFHEFIEDRNFAWERREPVAVHDGDQLLGLEFKGEHVSVTIAIDLQSGGVFNANTGGSVYLTEDFAQQIRDLNRKQFASLNSAGSR